MKQILKALQSLLVVEKKLKKIKLDSIKVLMSDNLDSVGLNHSQVTNRSSII